MVQSHHVVVQGEDGLPSKHPLKVWLRQNPTAVPDGMHPDDSTSHALRSGLKRAGWKIEFTPNEVLIIRPGSDGDAAYADDLLEEAVLQDSTHEVETEEQAELTFGLERDLQVALRTDIEQLEPGLKIIDGGAEHATRAGRIDILAQDEKGSSVIVELKAGQADSRVIAQVLAYMATVHEEQARPVRGIVVAGDFAERVVLAASAVPNLQLKRYTYKFSFEDP